MSDLKTVGAEIVSEVLISQATGKKWYASKTVWANLILGASIAVQLQTGFLIPVEAQAFVISGINIALRKITKEEIVW